MDTANQQANKEGADRNPAQQQRGYRGPPEKQTNKFIPNLYVKTESKSKGKPNAPLHLPAGQHRSQDTTSSQSAVRNEPILSSAFSTDFAVSEEQHVTEFTPAMTNLMLVANECLVQYSTDDTRLERSMIPEAFRYYFVAIAWIRIIALKDLQRQPLTQDERNVLSALVAEKFTIPEPLDVYIKQYGSVVPSTESHLYPAFPPLPVQQVNGFGGYYGPLNVDTHNLYEEIPCLGVAAEAVRRSLTNDEPGHYQSALTTQDLIANENLLGYEDLSLRLAEAKAKLLKLGISSTRFPEIVPSTGLNIRILQFVSNWIAQHPILVAKTVVVEKDEMLRLRFRYHVF
ncbi:hypothetical protein GE061_008174 [Apolygus lucorum]|uniref:Uncharacterized protein n=1 Tax=Apolygus lucorum TaxID=248454 RepID=A0A6A4ISP5_APOLU|nr:hypothetical protein GE061_008174 [Apolygus lucorum]